MLASTGMSVFLCRYSIYALYGCAIYTQHCKLYVCAFHAYAVYIRTRSLTYWLIKTNKLIVRCFTRHSFWEPYNQSSAANVIVLCSKQQCGWSVIAWFVTQSSGPLSGVVLKQFTSNCKCTGLVSFSALAWIMNNAAFPRICICTHSIKSFFFSHRPSTTQPSVFKI